MQVDRGNNLQVGYKPSFPVYIGSDRNLSVFLRRFMRDIKDNDDINVES